MKKILFTLLLLIITSSCTQEEREQIEEAAQYGITCKMNGTPYKAEGNAAINSKSNPMDKAVLLLLAYSSTEDSGEPPFTIYLLGKNIQAGNTIELYGGLSDMQSLSYKKNNIIYSTRNAADGVKSGSIKILSFGGRLIGQFSGTLYAESGQTLQLTEGTINVAVQTF